jgi:L-gulonolactone oxidase
MQNLTPELRKIAKEKHQFRNWANTFGCSPELYFEPSTEEEVSEVMLNTFRISQH